MVWLRASYFIYLSFSFLICEKEIWLLQESSENTCAKYMWTLLLYFFFALQKNKGPFVHTGNLEKDAGWGLEDAVLSWVLFQWGLWYLWTVYGKIASRRVDKYTGAEKR